MFFHLFLKGIKSYYLDDIYLISLFLGMLSLFNCTLVRKYSLKKTVSIYMLVSFCLYLSFRLLYAAQYTVFYGYQDYFESHTLAYDIFYNFGIWMFFIQVIWLFIGVRLIYHGDTWMSLFASVTYYMYVSLFADYIMPLLLVLLAPRVGESGYYYNFEIGGGVFYPFIGAVIAITLHISFRLWISPHMKVILDLPEKQMKKMTFIPVLSCITYNIIYLAMSYVKVYPNTPEGLPYFILIFGTIISVYMLMYAAMFFGIISTIKTTKVKAELDIASEIQKEHLPEDSDLGCLGQVDIWAQMTPALEVGGDFYDYFMVDENHLAIVIADVSGKGIAAALFMMMAKALIKACSFFSKEPGEIFMKVNKQFMEDNKSKMFITAFMGILDLTTGQFTYSNAGHNYPMIKRANGEYKKFEMKNDFILSGLKKINYHTYETKLEDGDEVFLYTDGVTEATNTEGILLGDERLLELLNKGEIINALASDKIKFIQEQIDIFKNKEMQTDDITMLLMKFKGSKKIELSALQDSV